MLFLLYLKFFKLPIRTRLLAGLSVCLILLLIGLAIVLNIFAFDGLSHLASDKTVFYLHWNWRPPDNFYRLKATDAILAKFGLSDFDRHQIASELAIVCDRHDSQVTCGLGIEAKQIKIIEQYLTDKKIDFRYLGKKIIVISNNKDWLNNLKISHNPLNYLKFQSGLSRYHELTVMVQTPPNLNSESAKLIYLLSFNQGQKINGLISTQGVILKKFELADLFSPPTLPATEQTDCDLIIETGKPKKNSLTEFNFTKLFGQDSDLLALFDSYPLAACLKKTGPGNNLLTDYGVNISSHTLLDNPARQKIEQGLIILASRLSPSSRSVYLNDGTKVVEFYPNIHNFEISRNGDTNTIDLYNGRKLVYKLSNQGLILSNSADQASLAASGTNNYLFARINNLPNTPIKKYLGDFSYLIANNNVLLIK